MKTPRIFRILLSFCVFIAFAYAFIMGLGDATLAPFAAFFQLQFGPALLRCVAAFSVSALAIVLAVLLVTFFFGRFYCAFLCPLGILQDFIGWITPGKAKPVKNFKTLRYLIALATFGLLAGGLAVGFRMLDPFSMFGRIANATLTPAALAVSPTELPARAPSASGVLIGACYLLIIAGLVIWKRRIFCTAICPVGTLLGLFASRGLFQLKLNNCVHCGRCANVCPAGCIDHNNGSLDNERCVRCMNCLAACKAKRIAFTTARAPAPTNPLRRAFFIQGAATFLGFTALAKLTRPKTPAPDALPLPRGICPPGAGSPARFASTCTACMLCAVNCRGKIIQPPDANAATPHLAFKRGFCEFNCKNCSDVCPTGALMPMTLEQKKRRRVGLAKFDSSLCVVFVNGTHCGACAEHCPTGALRMVDKHNGLPPIPTLNESLCIGCGGCEYICPVQPQKAISIRPVHIQVEAADPNDVFKRLEPETPPSDEWLI